MGSVRITAVPAARATSPLKRSTPLTFPQTRSRNLEREKEDESWQTNRF